MTATSPAPVEQQTEDSGPNLLYWIIGGVVVVLMIVGLITYSSHKSTQQAQQKAQELTQQFQNAGLRVPQDQDIIVKSLGTDGGAVCANPANALGRALLFDSLTNGASQVGRRPVIADARMIKGEALILQVYCPEKLQAFKDKFNSLKFDDTLGN